MLRSIDWPQEVRAALRKMDTVELDRYVTTFENAPERIQPGLCSTCALGTMGGASGAGVFEDAEAYYRIHRKYELEPKIVYEGFQAYHRSMSHMMQYRTGGRDSPPPTAVIEALFEGGHVGPGDRFPEQSPKVFLYNACVEELAARAQAAEPAPV